MWCSFSAGAFCARLMSRGAGWPRTLLTLAVVCALFVVSHPLGRILGAWPAVLVVAAAAGSATYALGRPAVPDPA